MIHNYPPSILSPLLAITIIITLNGYGYYSILIALHITNGLEFCPITNLICQMIVKSRITFNGIERRGRDAR